MAHEPLHAEDDAVGRIWTALGGAASWRDQLRVQGVGDLPSVFAVTDLAVAAAGCACLAVAELVAERHGGRPDVSIDRRLASFWFDTSLRPEGWALPPSRAPVTNDFRTADGWIRLHTNAPRHLEAAMEILGTPPEPDAVSRAVLRWTADALEAAILAAGGCAATMRDAEAWAAHPQGRAVAAEKLLHRAQAEHGPAVPWDVPRERPLRGVRVLDLTRILAGPVATRFLAGFGAEILRIDPPGWDEPAVEADVTLGKRCARLDLRRPGDRAIWEGLLQRADVVVHGYRPGALAGLGLGEEFRRELRPGLVDVSLDAYGWSGPWAGRRGFDSLVQMSSGIADAGMRQLGRDRPAPLPVQALDHATGYLLAAAAVRGLTERLRSRAGTVVRASLARTAALLMELPTAPQSPLAPLGSEDFDPVLEATAWGPAHRLKPPGLVAGAPMSWDLPARGLGAAAPAWLD